MKERVYIFVNGVSNWPGCADAWTDKAVSWIHQNDRGNSAEKFEYLAFYLSRYILTDLRADNLAKLIDSYDASFDVVLVAHSHGCEVSRRALSRVNRAVNSLHLFAPAVPATAHGLGWALLDHKIERLYIHVGESDRVLRLRGHSLLGALPASAIRKQFVSDRAAVFSREFGHSGWWTDEEFSGTMTAIKIMP